MKHTILKITTLFIVGTCGLSGGFVADNQTVTDTQTGLVWQDTATGKMIWEAAVEYCEALTLGGASDWRLPNRKELESLVSYGSSNPSIDSAFTNTQTASYWSSTTKAGYIEAGWSVSFYEGYVQTEPKTLGNYLRCVRGG